MSGELDLHKQIGVAFLGEAGEPLFVWAIDVPFPAVVFFGVRHVDPGYRLPPSDSHGARALSASTPW